MKQKRIILASGSPQRKKLLATLGLDFTIQPSPIEELQTIDSTCENFVKDNALLKASDIASQLKEGIVIGADTVVFTEDGQLITKPKNLTEAKKNLKVLFDHPQWVYTGVAVIDVVTGQQVIDYEKTKVFMNPLTDAEIDSYHQRVSPLDKAGGFDIEGLGGCFIHRVEGCYANVVGLPMAKLTKMLKKVGVSVLSLLMIVFLTGCTTEFNLATQKEERYLYDTEKEEKIGLAASQKIEKHYDLLEDVDVNERVNEILKKIVAVSDRKDIVYFIKVIDEDQINALSLPGGYIYIFRGLIDHIENDDQLAGVIAHEVGHITAKHSIKKIQGSYAALLAQLVAIQTQPKMAGGVNVALTSLFTAFSQKAEFEADKLSIKYMQAAGYDANAMVGLLTIMQNEHEKKRYPFSYWKTHPYTTKRISFVKKEIRGRMNFSEYVNLTGE